MICPNCKHEPCDCLLATGSQLDARITPAILESISRYNGQHPDNIVAMNEFKWDNVLKCFVFERGGMLHGVELDGYIHT